MSATDGIGSMLANRDQIVRQLANDPLLKNEELTETGNVSTDVILKREKELNNELHEFTSLKTVSGLILEFKTNLQLLELENCFYSLQALHKKLHSNSAIINRSFGLQRSIATYVDNMHLDLVQALFATLKDTFWKVTEDSIAFEPTVTCGPDHVQLEYVDVMESVENLYFPSGRLDSKLWIISDMVSGSLQETVRDRLNVILTEYVDLSRVVELIKVSLFTGNRQFSFDKDSSKLIFRYSTKNGDDKVEESVASFKNLLLFLRGTTALRDQKTMAQRLGSLIATELIKFIKVNSSVVFRPENSQLRDTIYDVNKDLVSLSKETQAWSYDGTQINDLFNNDQIPMNLHIDKVFHDRLTELRTFFADKSWQKLELVNLTALPKLPPQSPVRRKRPSSSSQRDSMNGDWGWDEEAGWDEHIDLDLDDKDAKSDIVSTKSKRDTTSDAAEDAWDEAWDIDIEDEASENRESGGDPDGSRDTEIRVTQLPAKVTALISDFEQCCRGSDQKVDEFYYRHKLNVLQTTIMAIASREYRDNWWQLHIDMNHIIQKNPSLTRLQELTYNNLDLNLNARESVVYRLTQQQLDELKLNERHCSWDATIDKLLPFIKSEVFAQFARIGKSGSEQPLLSFLKFLYDESIIKNILKWQIISEKTSENLSEFVSLVYSGTEIPALNPNKSYRECREKFAIIGKFLPLHLKDIMEMFYNGDFYLFTTDELIQWIVLLFAETPLRRNAIDDIYEIRNADVEEDD